MTLTTHALVGAAAASLFPTQPVTAFAAGFASHFLIDALPHWDYGGYLRSRRYNPEEKMRTDFVLNKDFIRDLALMGGDALLGIVLTFVFAWALNIPLAIALVGAGAGIYPDLLQFVYFKIKDTYAAPALEGLQLFHQNIQSHRMHWGPIKGLGMQALLVCVVTVAVLLV